MGELRELFAAQSRRAPAAGVKTEGGGIQFGASLAQVGAKHITVGHLHYLLLFIPV